MKEGNIMKRIVVLATLLAMVIGTASMASAADITATGSWKIFAAWSDNLDFDDNNVDSGDESDFDVWQRFRTQFNFTANENLTGALQLEIGTSTWGQPNDGADLGGDDVAIEVKHGYVNWVWPNTDVSLTAGLLPLALPTGRFGNPVMDDDVAAFVVNAPITDNVGVLAGWARPGSNLNADARNAYMDVVFAVVPLTFDGIGVTPYFARAYSNDNFGADVLGMAAADRAQLDDALYQLAPSNLTGFGQEELDAWWGGFAFNMTMFDPFTMDASFVYGSADASENFDRSGWLADIAVAYNGFDVVTPELFFTYSTGEDDDLGDSERLPTIAGDYAPDKVFFNSGGLVIDGPQDMAAQGGYWALGLNLKDISFLNGLTHEFNIMYAQGTNDENFANANANISKYGHTLTEEDSIWEFSLVNEYQIYDELTATLGLAYIAADYDEDTWGSAYDSADGARMSIGIEYKF
jgi:hypothetical protein